MKVEKKNFTEHPEGWFLFFLQEPEEVEAEWQGKKSTRLKWPCLSSEKDVDGENLKINIFTGMAVSKHKADMHRQLVVDGFGMSIDDYDDTDQIAGQLFAGKVEKNKDTGKVSIVQFDTKERVRPAAKKPQVDPFAEE